MNFNDKLLSDIVAFRTYARFLPEKQRRESLDETINRYLDMHARAFPFLAEHIEYHGAELFAKRAMPSMRALQFAGPAIEQNNARMFNCSYKAITDVDSFAEILFLLLSGCGVGFSVQRRHVASLPKVKAPTESGIFFVQDSIQGWAQALDILMRAYLLGHPKPVFDYGLVREKGAILRTTGARAPGPGPLKKMLEAVEVRFKAASGQRLRPIQVHDIVCLISECVRAGGIRRAALISLFSPDDEEMLWAKSGKWWKENPQRAGANNSVVLLRHTTTLEQFDAIFNAMRQSGAGEPGIYWTNDLDLGTNPCVEISLRDSQFCNLSTVNMSACDTPEDLYGAVAAASFFGTLQASYTDFPFLREKWQETTEEDALLGVSFTGIADTASRFDMATVATAAWEAGRTNFNTADLIGVNKAARVTAIKPEGSSSTVLGSSSGIHARHAPYYLRRIRLGSDDSALVEYLKTKVPGLLEDDKYGPDSVVLTVPQKSPKGAVCRNDENVKSQFYRAMAFNEKWVQRGHNNGRNHNNVSCTLSVKDDEWETLRNLMWINRFGYNGLSVLPYDGGTYTQAPFEECDEATYDKVSALVKDLDLREIVENEDATNMTAIVACAGGACEI